MKQWFLFPGILFLVFSIVFFNSCTNPIDSGSLLLEDDRASVGFTDTLSLNIQTVRADSVLTFSAGFNGQLTSYFFGKIQDDLFGSASASLYTVPLLLINQSGLYEEFEYTTNSTLDSIILVLPLDSSGIYGDVSGTFDMDVFQMTEEIGYGLTDELYYSNSNFMFDEIMPLANATFQPNFDSAAVTSLILESLADTITRGRHLRIPLSNSLGNSFLEQDSTVYNTDSTFVNFFNGLHLRPSVVSEGFLDFDLYNKRWGGIYIYYTEQDTAREYIFPISSFSSRVSRYEHDYSGALVNDFLDNPVKGDSLAFLQGLEGLFTKIEIPNLDKLTGRIINKAELELNVATLEDYDPTTDTPPAQLIVYTRNSDGNLAVIEDVNISPNDLSLYFGGQVEELSNGNFRYLINLSIHLQKMLDGSAEPELYIGIFPRAANASRVILNGAKTAVNPARLKVSFTDI